MQTLGCGNLDSYILKRGIGPFGPLFYELGNFLKILDFLIGTWELYDEMKLDCIEYKRCEDALFI